MATKVIEFDYNGETVPIAIGYYALKRFKQERGYDFEDSSQDDPLEDLEVLFWYSMEAGFKHKQKQDSQYPDNKFNREEDLDLLLDALLPEFTQAIPSFFRLPETPTTTTGSNSGTPKPSKSSPRKKKTPTA